MTMMTSGRHLLKLAERVIRSLLRAFLSCQIVVNLSSVNGRSASLTPLYSANTHTEMGYHPFASLVTSWAQTVCFEWTFL
jgi:hypothetical protein